MANQCRISFERNKILGRGGFGNVYLGTLLTEEGTVEQVAVKRDLTTQLEDREFIHQGKLGKHPNVVELLDWEDQGDDFRCFALELCQFSLDKVYRDPEKYQSFLPSQLEFMLQLSNGLEYIHSKNLIHRDIKPHNVLISKSSDNKPLVKWGDFGLSKETSREQCILSGKKGTDWYWAPEIWKMWKNNNDRLEQNNDDKKVMTIMSDIFSTGSVFFEFCTCGIHPFGEGEMEIKTNLSMEPSNPYNLNDFKLNESHFAYKIIKRMLETDPKVRPNLREIIQSLLTLQKFVELKQKLKHNEKNQEIKEVEHEFQKSLVICESQSDEKDANTTITEVDKAQQELENMKKELHYLCSRSNPTEEQIRKIVEISTVDTVGLVNMVDDNGFSPLLLMCRNNRSGSLVGHIKALLTTCPREERGINEEIKVDVNYQDRNRSNALHHICSHYQGDDFLEILNLLTQCGMDLNRTDKAFENNALQLFFRDNKRSTGVVQIVRALIQNGINLKHRCILGWPPLHDLCRNYTHNNLIEVAKLLVNNGVNVNAKTSNGWTALYHLCRYYTHNNLIDVAKLLVDNGVDVSAKLSYGWTALHFLCQYYTHNNLIEVAKLLVDNGVDVNARTSDGWTALNILCVYYIHNNLIEVAKLLVDNGVDVNAKTSNGWTALHLLCRNYPHNNLNDIIQLFIDRGIDIHVQTTTGHSASDLLQKFSSYNHGNKSEVLELLKNGNYQRKK